MLIKYSGKYVKIYFNMKITYVFIVLVIEIWTIGPSDLDKLIHRYFIPQKNRCL